MKKPHILYKAKMKKSNNQAIKTKTKKSTEEYDENRLQEHRDALQLAEWRKHLPCKAVCDYLDENLPGWRDEPDM